MVDRAAQSRKQSKCGSLFVRHRLSVSKIASVILVQGLNAHPYYTWVGYHGRSKLKATQSGRFARFTGLLRVRNSGDKKEEDLEISSSLEVFWPKDLLPRHLPSSSIATYSYPSSWLSREFATDLRKCGEQLLNILFQYRRTNKVSHGKRQNK